LGTLKKTVENLHVFLNSDMENWYLHAVKLVYMITLRRITFEKINFFEGNFSQKQGSFQCLNISLLKFMSFVRKCGKML